MNLPLTISHFHGGHSGTFIIDARGGLVASMEAGYDQTRDQQAAEIIAAVNLYQATIEKVLACSPVAGNA